MKDIVEINALKKDNNLYIANSVGNSLKRNKPTSSEIQIYEAITESVDLTSTSYELKSKIDDIEKEYQFSPLRTNLVRVFDYKHTTRILEIQCGAGAITRYFAEQGFYIDAIENNINLAVSAAKRCKNYGNACIIAGDLNNITLGGKEYDLILCVGLVGYAAEYLGIENSEQAVNRILNTLYSALSSKGILFIASENRTGYKYVLGAHEDHTMRQFEGVHNYPNTKGIKTFTKREWINQIDKSGYGCYEFIYPFPDYKYPTFLITENYIKEGKYVYNHLESINSRDYHSILDPGRNEKLFWESANANGTLEEFSNSFCILLAKNRKSIDDFVHFDFVHLPGYNRKLIFSTQVVKPKGENAVSRTYLMPVEERRIGSYSHQLNGVEVYHDGPLLSVEWSRALLYCKYDFSNFEKSIKEYYSFLRNLQDKSREGLNIDLIPSNIIIAVNRWVVIDREWKSVLPISVDILMFRALIMFAEKYRSFMEEFCELKRIYCRWDFIKWGMNLVGLPTDYEHLHRLKKEDDKFQQIVADRHEPIDLFESLIQPVFNERPIISVFWKDEDQQYEMDRLVSETASISDELQTVEIGFPKEVRILHFVRIDPCGSFRKEKASFFRLYAIRVFARKSSGDRTPLWSLEGEKRISGTVNLVGMRYEKRDLGPGFTIIDYDAWIECYVIPLRRLEQDETFFIELEIRYPRTFEYLLARDRYLVAAEIANDEREEMESALNKLSNVQLELETIRNSRVWRFAERARTLVYGKALPMMCSGIQRFRTVGRVFKPKVQSGEKVLLGAKAQAAEKSRYELWLEKRPKNYWINVSDLNISPKISIVTPVYRISETLLEDTIKSVEGQTYRNWELCIVDDGSGDEKIKDVLESLQDKRIAVQYSKKNINISAASNLAAAEASGDYITFLDHDDILAPNALTEVVAEIEKNNPDILYTDEDFISPGGHLVNPHFKPDYSPDLLLSHNYITHLLVVKRELFEQVGGFRVGYEGAQDYDLILRLTEKTSNIKHISKPVYHWRMSEQSTAMQPDIKPKAFASSKMAVSEALNRRYEEALIEEGKLTHFLRVKRVIKGNPLVSIIIPFKDNPRLLKNAITNILNKSVYINYEIIGVSNDSTMATTYSLMKELEKFDCRIKFIELNEKFNYSKIVNYGVLKANGSQIVLFNNDIEVINGDWIEALLEHSQREEIGVVGAKLYYPNNTIQHAGIAVGLGGGAGHMHLNYPGYHEGYFNRLQIVQNVTAVTGALMMFKKRLFEEIGGMDKDELPVAYNDVDFCLKALKLGYLNIFTPYCEAYHYESKTRGYETTPEKRKRFKIEKAIFTNRYKNEIEGGDAYYNSNLNQGRDDFRYW